MNRFFGGPPLWVILRLIVLSVAVGVVLHWFDLTPFALIDQFVAFGRRLLDRGFETVREVAVYFVYGAVIVIPVWLIIRLIGTARGR